MRSKKTMIALGVLLLGSALADLGEVAPAQAGCRERHQTTGAPCADRPPPTRDLSQAPQPTPQSHPRSANAPGGFR